jgi:transcriptional regulator with XRE-family HTH domain
MVETKAPAPAKKTPTPKTPVKKVAKRKAPKKSLASKQKFTGEEAPDRKEPTDAESVVEAATHPGHAKNAARSKAVTDEEATALSANLTGSSKRAAQSRLAKIRNTMPANSIGKRVRLQRLNKNITQKELARLCGCSQQTVVDLETARVIYSRFTAVMAEHLGVSLHWLETGEGSRERAGPSQGRVAVVGWEYYLGDVSGVQNAQHQVTDWLENCPVDHSGDTVMTIVDERIAFVMSGRVRSGEWLYVDRKRHDDGLVVVLMPGWNRAELRELTTIGGRRFLASTNPDVPDRLVACDVTTAYAEFDKATKAAEANPENTPPALVIGRVIFRGVPES